MTSFVSSGFKITVDDREQHSGVVQCLKAKRLSVEIQRLKYGDYHIRPGWGIERKTARDFNLSIVDGRLFKQVYHLKRVYSHPILIIEGNPFHTPIQIDPRAIRGAVLTTQTVWYLPVIHSRSVEDTGEILATLARYALNATDDHLPRGGYKPKRLKNRQIYLLCGLPGIGPTLARRLLERFKTVAAVTAADQDVLAQVDGIGLKTAENIRRLLDRPYLKS